MPRGYRSASDAELATLPKNRTHTKTTSRFTDKQKTFLDLWASGESVYSASIKAGYTDHGTSCGKLAKTQPALDYYHREKKKYEEAAQMSRKKVMDMLVEAYELAKLTAEPSSMVAAAREIGKMCGYYAPTQSHVTVDVSGNVAVQRLNAMTDQELIDLISRRDDETVSGHGVQQLPGPADQPSASE